MQRIDDITIDEDDDESNKNNNTDRLCSSRSISIIVADAKQPRALLYFILLLLLALGVGVFLPSMTTHNTSTHHLHSFPNRKGTLPDLAEQERLTRENSEKPVQPQPQQQKPKANKLKFGIMTNAITSTRRVAGVDAIRNIAYSLGRPFTPTPRSSSNSNQNKNNNTSTTTTTKAIAMPPLPLVHEPTNRRIVYAVAPMHTGCLSTTQSELVTFADVSLLDNQHQWAIFGVDASFLCTADAWSADITAAVFNLMRQPVSEWPSIDVLIAHFTLRDMELFVPLVFHDQHPTFMGTPVLHRPTVRIGRLVYEWYEEPAQFKLPLTRLWDEVWATSEYARDELINEWKVPASRVWVVPESVSVESFVGQPARGARAAATIDPSWGVRMHSRLNLVTRVKLADTVTWQTTVAAFVRAFSGYRDVSLTVIMNDNTPGIHGAVDRSHEAAIAQQVAAYAMSTHTPNIPTINIVTRAFSTQELAHLYHSMDAFVYPSPALTNLLPLMQAVASHLPVITTGWAAANGTFTNDNAFLVRPGKDIQTSFPRAKQPSVDDVIAHMRMLVSTSTAGEARAARAYNELMPRWQQTVVAQAYLTRINSHLS